MLKKIQILALSPLAVTALLLTGCSDDGDSASSTSTASTTSSTDLNDTSSSSIATSDTDNTSSSTETTAGGDSAGADCYVHLFDSDDFDESDGNYKLTKPGRYADLKNLPDANDDWTDDADSIKVGAGATVTIWSDTDFNGDSKKLEPGSEHADVDEPSSLEMTC